MSEDAELTPEEEREISRLLSESAGPVPTPPEVVARLDDTLARLVDARSTERTDDTHQADQLATLRNRRRRWPQVVLAAAAVVVGGYGVGAVLDRGSPTGAGGESATGLAGSAGPSAESDSGGVDALGERGVRGSGPDGWTDPSTDAGGRAEPTVARLRSDRLELGIRRTLRSAVSSPEPSSDKRGIGCALPETGPRDRWLAIRLDGRPAALLAGPERRGRVDTTIYSCDGTVLAETIVTAP